MTKKLDTLNTVFYVAKALIELLFWVSSTYINIKFYGWISKFREISHFKKVLKASSIPKDLRKALISEYKQALAKVYSQLSIESMIKRLIKKKSTYFS